MPYTIPVPSPDIDIPDHVFDEEEGEALPQDGDQDEEGETTTESEEEEEDEDYVPNARVSPNTRLNPARRIVFEEEEEVSIIPQRDEQCEQEASTSYSTKRIGSPVLQEADGVCCPVCMESWSSEGNHQVCCLPCGHVYGFSCIEKWIKQSGRHSAKCPQCSRKCNVKDIIKLYVSRIAVVDGEQQKKVLSLQSENEFLKMKIATLQEQISHDNDEKMCKEASCLENVYVEESQMRNSEFSTRSGDSRGQMLPGYTSGVGHGSSSCSFALEVNWDTMHVEAIERPFETFKGPSIVASPIPPLDHDWTPLFINNTDELVVEGARIFDMDAFNRILILARRLPGSGGHHVLTKMSLMYPYDSENIQLPLHTKAVKDLHVSPSAGKHVLFASLGKKLSILSMESNNIVLSYNLSDPAWSCSWDLNNPHHIYAGMQNGMLLVFDMRHTAGPMESKNGLSFHPVHTIHSLVHKSHTPCDVRTLLSASSIGPCVWNIGGSGERPFLVPEVENQGVCVSLAYCASTDDIVASFRPKVNTSNDIIYTQPSISPSLNVIGRGILGFHVLIKRVGGNHYQKLGVTSANVNDVRMPKSAIVQIENCNPLLAYGDEVTRGLSLCQLPSFRVMQNLEPHTHPILDVKFAPSLGHGILGCTSEDKLQLYSAKLSS